MPGTVIGKSLNLGYAGKISRDIETVVSARFAKSILDGNGNETLPAIPFGSAVVLNTDNTYALFGATGSGVATASATTFAGIAAAEVKQITTYGTAATGSYTGTQSTDVISKGSVTVFCKEGTPVAGGAVYAVTVAATTGGISAVGDIIAQATPAGTGSPATVLITNAKWTTGKLDANLIAELTLLTRVNP